MSDLQLNPVDIERRIDEISNRIAKSVGVVSERESVAREKRTAFDEAYAHAYLAAQDSPAHERKYRATLATVKERREAEVAETAYRYADRKVSALEKELFAWQSISKSVVAMYGAVRS